MQQAEATVAAVVRARSGPHGPCGCRPGSCRVARSDETSWQAGQGLTCRRSAFGQAAAVVLGLASVLGACASELRRVDALDARDRELLSALPGPRGGTLVRRDAALLRACAAAVPSGSTGGASRVAARLRVSQQPDRGHGHRPGRAVQAAGWHRPPTQNSSGLKCWWRHRDLNPGHSGYEPLALTD